MNMQILSDIEKVAVALATERCANGWTWPKNDLEVDHEIAVSTGEHGVWVRAWVLVDAADLAPCQRHLRCNKVRNGAEYDCTCADYAEDQPCVQHRDTGRGVCCDCGVAL